MIVFNIKEKKIQKWSEIEANNVFFLLRNDKVYFFILLK